jgi:hypothetical protein
MTDTVAPEAEQQEEASETTPARHWASGRFRLPENMPTFMVGDYVIRHPNGRSRNAMTDWEVRVTRPGGGYRGTEPVDGYDELNPYRLNLQSTNDTYATENGTRADQYELAYDVGHLILRENPREFNIDQRFSYGVAVWPRRATRCRIRATCTTSGWKAPTPTTGRVRSRTSTSTGRSLSPWPRSG